MSNPASNLLFSSLANHLTVPVVITTVDSDALPATVAFVNNGFLSLTGFSEEQLIGKQLVDVFQLKEGTSIQVKVREQLRSSEPSSLEVYIQTSDSRKIWFQFRIQYLALSEGEAYLWTQEENPALPTLHPTFQVIDGNFSLKLKESPQPVFAFDRKGKLIFANHRFCQKTGYSFEELIVSGFGVVLIPEEHQLAEHTLKLTLNGAHQEVEFSVLPRNGGVLHWQIDSYPIYSQEHISGIICFAQDITQLTVRKQDELTIKKFLSIPSEYVDLREGLSSMMKEFCSITSLDAGEVWLPDYLHKKERLFAFHYPEGPTFLRYRDFSTTLEIPYHSELPKVMADQRNTVVNLFLESDFPRKKATEEAGFTAGFSVPVFSGNNLVATLMFFSRETLPDEIHTIRLIRMLAGRLGTYIESRRNAMESERIFDLVPDFLCILDRSGRFYRVNSRLASVLGPKPEELSGQSFFDWVDDEYMEISLSAFQKLQGESISRFENVMRNQDGKKFWLEWSLSSNNQEGIVYAAGKDLTIRILYDEELRNQNERFRLLRQATNDAIYDWDIRLDEIDWGDSFKRLFGHEINSEGSDLGGWEDFIHPVDRDRVVGNLNAAMLSKSRYWIDEYQYLCADETYKYILDRGIFLYDEKGNAIRMIGTMQDITPLKQSEATLIQLNDALQHRAHQLMGFNKELEQFAYIVSHDLQEPLRMISSFMQLLLNSKEVSMTERSEQYISFAIDGANRMKRLIQDLLTYSRVGTTEEDYAELNMQELVKDTLQVYQQMIRERDARISFGHLPAIRGIRSLIQQIIDNLLSNAIKYNDKPRPEIHFDCSETPTHYVFSIKDNGIGIDPRQKDLIYLPFKRLHNKNEYSGTGIGLAVCKKIAEKHHGQIWVESTPALGSTFFFSVHK